MAIYIHGKPKTERIYGLGEYSEEWVDVRRLTWADMNEIQKRGDEFKGDNNKLVVYMIAAFSLTDMSGNPLPVSIETLQDLPAEIVTPVVTRINELFLALQPSKSDK